jgi:hypothetical protein
VNEERVGVLDQSRLSNLNSVLVLDGVDLVPKSGGDRLRRAALLQRTLYTSIEGEIENLSDN